jgi:hypothetical protein
MRWYSRQSARIIRQKLASVRDEGSKNRFEIVINGEYVRSPELLVPISPGVQTGTHGQLFLFGQCHGSGIDGGSIGTVVLYIQLTGTGSPLTLLIRARALHRIGVRLASDMSRARDCKLPEVTTVLWTLFVILLIAWILGLVGVYQIGSIIWLLLVAAVVVLILQLVTGRRTVV